MSTRAELQPCAFTALPGWQLDDHVAAFEAFRRCALYAQTGNYRSGRLGSPFESFHSVYQAALAFSAPSIRDAREFFEQHFQPFRVAAPGFVTGFYEPVAVASPVKTDVYRYPVYSPPVDLVQLTEGHNHPGLPQHFRFARRSLGGKLVEYYDRQAIETGALEGLGLEIAWLADRVDLFFIHVQGAARLKMTDGREMRITYAAKSGHDFTGPGAVLAELGEIPRAEVTMQRIRAWLSAHPARMDGILWRNRSYIFFRPATVEEATLGPIAAAKVPLTPLRSLAVDRMLHTFSTPFYIDAPELHINGDSPFRQLMIAQDTGSAITGPARGDLFIGSGPDAGEIAGVIRHRADFYCLLPKSVGTSG